MARSSSLLLSRPAAIIVLRAVWTLVVLWYELGAFSWSLRDCSWPDTLLHPSSATRPEHVLVIADPQILDHRSYPERGALLTKLSQFIVDWNLRKSWRATRRLSPDVVVFLGDMMDSGRFDMVASEYERYFARFKSIFTLPASVPVYYLPGNHDVALGESETFSKYARERYMTHFGPLNQQKTVGNHTLVLIDAPSLVNEDRRRAEIGMSYDNWTPAPGGTAQFVQYLRPDHYQNGAILFTHIPLYRPDGSSCGPLRERGTIRRGAGLGYQNTLSESASRFLLDRVQPVLILSGDDHDYCEYNHTLVPNDGSSSERSEVREVTVKSFSMAMGIRRPGFQLLSLAAQRGNRHSNSPSRETIADRACLLPDQVGIYLSVYIPLVVVSVSILAVANVLGRRGREGSLSTFRGTHRRSDSFPHRNSDDVREDEAEAYLLPTVRDGPGGSSFRREGGRQDVSVAFSAGGVRRRVRVPWGAMGLGGRRRGLRGFVQDVAETAWPVVLLFVLNAVWIFR